MADQWNRAVLGLGKLKCPFLTHISSMDSVMKEGELRNSLLNWLFFRYNPEWMQDREIQQEAELVRLTHLANTLGLCSATDTQLVKGVTKDKKKNINFILAFVDLVLLNEQFDGEALQAQHARDVQFMAQISNVSYNNFNALMAGEVELLCDQILKPTRTNKSPSVQIKDLEQQYKDLEGSVAKLKDELASLEQERAEKIDGDNSGMLLQAQETALKELADHGKGLSDLNHEIAPGRRRAKGRVDNSDLTPLVGTLLDHYRASSQTLRDHKAVHENYQRLATSSLQGPVPIWLDEASLVQTLLLLADSSRPRARAKTDAEKR